MKYISFFLAFTFISLQGVQAQIKDKIVPHMGFMVEYVKLSTPPIPGGEVNQTVRNFYTFNFGAYYAALHRNDVMSIGIEPSVQFGLNPYVAQTANGDQFVLDYIVQTPVYLMGRLGANATPFNSQKFGIAAGIGGAYTIFDQGTNQAQFFNPSAVVEVTIGTRNSTLTGRAHFSLADTRSTLKFENAAANRDFDFGNWGFGIIYAF